MMKNQLQIPPPRPLHSTIWENFHLRLWLDEAFALPEHVMLPYVGHNLIEKKRIFNYCLNRARRYVEYAFGILFNK